MYIPHDTYSTIYNLYQITHIECVRCFIAGKLRHVCTCVCSHGRFVPSRLSALLLQRPSLVHLASSTFLTQRQSSKTIISRISVSNRTYDLQPIWTIKICRSSIHGFRLSSMLTATPHRYIHLKGILVPAFVDNKPHRSFLDISIDFIKERPTSDLELVFKDGAGDKQQSKKFRKSVPIYWSLDMFVHAISIIILRY